MASEPQAEQTLRAGSVGLFGDFIGAVTNVAPTLDVALTLGAFLLATGLAAPSTILMAGAAMLCISLGYGKLNQLQPNAAAGVLWLRRIRPALGFAMGVLIVLMMGFILIANQELAGGTILSLISSSLASNLVLVWFVGAIVTIIAVGVAVIGVRTQVRFQGIIVVCEYVIIATCAIAILVAHGLGHLSTSPSPSITWLSPTTSHFGSSGIVSGIVLAVFSLAGWENPIYLGEEQRHAHRDPGRSAFLGVIWGTLFITFLMVAFKSAAPSAALANHAANLLSFATGRVLPEPFPLLVSIALLSALTGATQANASNGARTMFGMARAKVFPAFLGKVHPRFRTPHVGLWGLAIVAIVVSLLYVTSTAVVTVLVDVTSTVGYLYIVVYVAIALTAIWVCRRSLGSSFGSLVVGGILPALGAAFLVYSFVVALPTAGVGVLIPTFVILAIAIGGGFAMELRSTAPFFTNKEEEEAPPQAVV